MNKNIRLAKQLIKIAKSLIASDEQVENFIEHVLPQAIEALGFEKHDENRFTMDIPQQTLSFNNDENEVHYVYLGIIKDSGNKNSVRCNLKYVYDHERYNIQRIDNETTISFEPDIDSFINAFKKGLREVGVPSYATYFDYRKAKAVSINFLENAGY